MNRKIYLFLILLIINRELETIDPFSGEDIKIIDISSTKKDANKATHNISKELDRLINEAEISIDKIIDTIKNKSNSKKEKIKENMIDQAINKSIDNWYNDAYYDKNHDYDMDLLTQGENILEKINEQNLNISQDASNIALELLDRKKMFDTIYALPKRNITSKEKEKYVSGGYSYFYTTYHLELSLEILNKIKKLKKIKRKNK